jgi:AraC-like DNA-binding protein
MATAETTVEFLNACCRLLDLLSAPEDIPFLSGLIQREIVYRILRSAEGSRLRAIATLGEQSHRTAKVIAWIKANYEKPLRVEELAELAGMGVSTLHHHFRVLTAMSPLQYQKQLRLQAARGRMLMDGLDAASGGIRKRQPVQSRIQPVLRATADAGCKESSFTRGSGARSTGPGQLSRFTTCEL